VYAPFVLQLCCSKGKLEAKSVTVTTAPSFAITTPARHDMHSMHSTHSTHSMTCTARAAHTACATLDGLPSEFASAKCCPAPAMCSGCQQCPITTSSCCITGAGPGAMLSHEIILFRSRWSSLTCQPTPCAKVQASPASERIRPQLFQILCSDDAAVPHCRQHDTDRATAVDFC
jgi:hypothetical protein